MRSLWHHIVSIIETYDGSLPLAAFLKQLWAKHKVLGSRDRKVIADAVYAFYRCAKALPDALSVEEKVACAIVFSEKGSPHTQKLLPPERAALFHLPQREIEAALHAEGIDLDASKLFPDAPLSDGFSRADAQNLVLLRPRLFIRPEGKHGARIKQLLLQAGIAFEQPEDKVFSLPATTNLESILRPEMYRVQDYSSMRTAAFFKAQNGDRVWDCCSGAGGKSLLLTETAPEVRLLTTDVRASILHNLKKRFELYGRKAPEQMVLSAADAAETDLALAERTFDHIIADVPCTGSGTWARTPEQLYFFDVAALPEFANRQQRILANALRYLAPGGTLTYITCSMFAAENEAVVQHVLRNFPDVHVEAMSCIEGSAFKADNMFAALLRKK